MYKFLIILILIFSLSIVNNVFGEENAPQITDIEIVDSEKDTDKNEDKCLIEVAFEGSNSEEISLAVLRDFRDNHLLKSKAGQSLVEIYYKNSSTMAAFVEENDFLKTGIRTILSPVVAIAYLF